MSKHSLFYNITGAAMKVHNKFGYGLLESVYEAGLEYVLSQSGHTVERQVHLPIYWDEVQLQQTFRLDLVVDGVIIELKAMAHIDTDHRRQLWNYMRLTHTEYGMLINFGRSVYAEWYQLQEGGEIVKRNLCNLN